MSRFTKAKIKRNCLHLDKRIMVIQSPATCETIVTICNYCKKQLTEPKTDCR